jgi:hypothetical protein
MTNSATPNLLSLIRKIREERRSGDLMRLTDAELVAKLARGLSSNTGDERLIACALSVSRRAPHARPDQRDGDLGRALALLQEAGYSGFSLAQLAAVRQSAAFRKLRDLRAPFVVWKAAYRPWAGGACRIFRALPRPINRVWSGRGRLKPTAAETPIDYAIYPLKSSEFRGYCASWAIKLRDLFD